MAERKVKADVSAADNSLIGMLKRRRKAAESGYDTGEGSAPEEPTAMNDAEEPKPTADDYRGYTKEKWDE